MAQALSKEEQKETHLLQQLAEARAIARVLAHAYASDNKPPAYAVEKAMSFPVSGVIEDDET